VNSIVNTLGIAICTFYVVAAAASLLFWLVGKTFDL
jgi:hypothetical protein